MISLGLLLLLLLLLGVLLGVFHGVALSRSGVRSPRHHRVR